MLVEPLGQAGLIEVVRGDRELDALRAPVRESPSVISGVDRLREGFGASSRRLGRVLADLGDQEFFWEPAPGCSAVHRRW